jgi:Flp pilus assembly protein TadD
VTLRDKIRLKHVERQAEGYLELGMAQQALDALARLGDEDQLGDHALYLRGEALRALERYEEALAPFEKIARAAPEDMHVWLALGWCYKRIGRMDRAVAAMEQALKVEPKEAILHYNLACYLSLTGDKDRALRHLSKAFSFDPGYRAMVESEPDFDPIRSDPDFQALLSTVA